MFFGTYEPRLDDKGRLILPAKFRDQVATGLVLTRGQERALAAYPSAVFEAIHAKLVSKPLPGMQVRDFARLLFSGAADIVPDKQGRIIVPPALREYAHLQRDLTVIGVGDHFEVWDAQSWSQYLQEKEEVYAASQDAIFGSELS